MAERKVPFSRDREVPTSPVEADVGEHSTTTTVRLRNNLVDDESARLLNPRTYESTSIPASLVEAAEVTVLLADDERSSRLVSTGLLREGGFKVHPSDGVLDAISVFNRERPDSFSAIVLVLTSEKELPLAAALVQEGATEYIVKSSTGKKLTQRIFVHAAQAAAARLALRQGAQPRAAPPQRRPSSGSTAGGSSDGRRRFEVHPEEQAPPAGAAASEPPPPSPPQSMRAGVLVWGGPDAGPASPAVLQNMVYDLPSQDADRPPTAAAPITVADAVASAAASAAGRAAAEGRRAQPPVSSGGAGGMSGAGGLLGSVLWQLPHQMGDEEIVTEPGLPPRPNSSTGARQMNGSSAPRQVVRLDNGHAGGLRGARFSASLVELGGSGFPVPRRSQAPEPAFGALATMGYDSGGVLTVATRGRTSFADEGMGSFVLRGKNKKPGQEGPAPGIDRTVRVSTAGRPSLDSRTSAAGVGSFPLPGRLVNQAGGRSSMSVNVMRGRTSQDVRSATAVADVEEERVPAQPAPKKNVGARMHSMLKRGSYWTAPRVDLGDDSDGDDEQARMVPKPSMRRGHAIHATFSDDNLSEAAIASADSAGRDRAWGAWDHSPSGALPGALKRRSTNNSSAFLGSESSTVAAGAEPTNMGDKILGRKISRVISRAISFGRRRGAEAPVQTEAQRLWGVVRDVVMAKDVDLGVAIEKASSFDGDMKDLTMAMFREARLNYIRKRLDGEWFPEDKEVEKPHFHIRPNGRVRRTWDALLLLFVLFNAWEVPFVVGINPPPSHTLDAFDTFITALFGVDVILGFFTAVAETGRSGELITNRTAIARHYCSNWFLVDLVSTIPFDTIVAMAVGSGGSGKQLRLLGFLKTPRLLRLSKVLRYLDKLKGANIFRIVRLTMLICMIAHWVACGYALLADFETSKPTWVEIGLAANYGDATYIASTGGMSMYAQAFYNSWMMLTGSGALAYTSEERMYISFVIMLGGFVQAVIVGNVALLVTNWDAVAARYQLAQEMSTTTAQYLELPDSVLDRITGYFESMASTGHPGNEGMAQLANLPRGLRSDIAFHLHGEALNSVPLLRGHDAAFIAELALQVVSTVVIKDEAVYNEGDISREMYFLVQGSVVVLHGQEGHSTILPAGSFFGELALLADVRRSATVRASVMCDVNVLSRAAMCKVLLDFEEVEERIRERGRRRLRELMYVRQHSIASSRGDLPHASHRDHDETIVRTSNLLKGGAKPTSSGSGPKNFWDPNGNMMGTGASPADYAEQGGAGAQPNDAQMQQVRNWAAGGGGLGSVTRTTSDGADGKESAGASGAGLHPELDEPGGLLPLGSPEERLRKELIMLAEEAVRTARAQEAAVARYVRASTGSSGGMPAE